MAHQNNPTNEALRRCGYGARSVPAAMPRRTAALACLLATVALLFSTGCTFLGRNPFTTKISPEEQHQQWWAKTKSRAQYVEGKGYYVAETGRYYDGNGRVIYHNEDSDISHASFEEHLKGQQANVGLADLAPQNWNRTVRKATGRGPNPKVAREMYTEAEAEFDRAIDLLKQDKKSAGQATLVSAAAKYKEAGLRWPDSALEEDALFKHAECEFFADRYSRARDGYDELIKKFPSTKHLDVVDARRFAIAQYWLQIQKENPQWFLAPNFFNEHRPRFDTFGNAIKVYDQIRIDDPTGNLADDATMAAGNAQFLSANYLKAETFYSDLRRSFPNSRHQFEAHLLGLKCKLELYEGPDYDGTVLDEAEQLVKQMQRQFPDKFEQHREYLVKAFKEIRLRKAERDYRMASYYDGRGEYRAARMYYDIVRREFSDTSLGKQSEERIAVIQNYPDVPAKKLAWIVDVFEDKSPPLVANATRENDEPGDGGEPLRR